MKKLNLKGWLVVYLVLAMGLVGIMKLTDKPSLEESVKWVTVRVYEGDTLWTLIDEKNDVHLDELRDMAEYNDANKEHWINGRFNLQAGLQVRIPVVKK